MGVQVHIRIADMLAVPGVSVTTEQIPGEEDQDGNYSPSYTLAVYTIPGLGEWRSYCPVDFVVDFNDWGSNKGQLMPWIEAHNVPFGAW